MSGNAIKTVMSYETRDGEKFDTIEAAQTHTRRSLYKAIRDEAIKIDPAVFSIPEEALIDFLMKHGKRIAAVATDEMKPLDLRMPAGGVVRTVTDPAAGARSMAAGGVVGAGTDPSPVIRTESLLRPAGAPTSGESRPTIVHPPRPVAEFKPRDLNEKPEFEPVVDEDILRAAMRNAENNLNGTGSRPASFA